MRQVQQSLVHMSHLTILKDKMKQSRVTFLIHHEQVVMMESSENDY